MNGNIMWVDSIAKNLAELGEYNILNPSDYKKFPYHIVFVVKFDLRRKARLVARGQRIGPLAQLCYSR